MKKELTVQEFDMIQELNQQHGRTLAYDLTVAQRHGGEVFVAPPRIFPSAVRQKRTPFANLRVFTGAEESRKRVSGMETVLHGEAVWYEKVYDTAERRLRFISRHVGHSSGGLIPIGSHYHVSVIDHFRLDEGLGRPVMGLDNDFQDFNEVFDALNREVLIYRGELEDSIKPTAYTGKRPPVDLGVAMLQSFILGLRDGAHVLSEEDVLERAAKLLDRLPL